MQFKGANGLKLAIVACAGKTGHSAHYDDKSLKAVLTHRGAKVDIIDWKAVSKDKLKKYDGIIVTTTWNLHRYPEEFEAWIESCEEDGRKRLINDKELLQAGIRKDRYLVPLLEQFGIKDSKEGCIIPSVFVKDGDTNQKYKNKSFLAILEELKKENPSIWSGDVVIKPITSADGDNTYRLTTNAGLIAKDNAKCKKFDNGNKLFDDILKNKNSNGVIIQPFMKAVEDSGEYQLIFIDGEFTHATLKSKGFKEYGKRTEVNKDDLPAGMYDFAASVVDFLRRKYAPSVMTRIRVDLFASAKGPILCEAEMVEPNTSLSCLKKDKQTEVVNKFADAIIVRAFFYQIISKKK